MKRSSFLFLVISLFPSLINPKWDAELTHSFRHNSSTSNWGNNVIINNNGKNYSAAPFKKKSPNTWMARQPLDYFKKKYPVIGNDLSSNRHIFEDFDCYGSWNFRLWIRDILGYDEFVFECEKKFPPGKKGHKQRKKYRKKGKGGGLRKREFVEYMLSEGPRIRQRRSEQAAIAQKKANEAKRKKDNRTYWYKDFQQTQIKNVDANNVDLQQVLQKTQQLKNAFEDSIYIKNICEIINKTKTKAGEIADDELNKKYCSFCSDLLEVGSKIGCMTKETNDDGKEQNQESLEYLATSYSKASETLSLVLLSNHENLDDFEKLFSQEKDEITDYCDSQINQFSDFVSQGIFGHQQNFSNLVRSEVNESKKDNNNDPHSPLHEIFSESLRICNEVAIQDRLTREEEERLEQEKQKYKEILEKRKIFKDEIENSEEKVDENFSQLQEDYQKSKKPIEKAKKGLSKKILFIVLFVRFCEIL